VKTKTHTTTIEVPVEVEYSVEGENTPPYFDRSFGNYLPGDIETVEVHSVLVSMVGRDGVKRSVDVLPVLDRQVEEGILDELDNLGGDDP
jgi:hypothetical protein